jgi:hypothetical protein
MKFEDDDHDPARHIELFRVPPGKRLRLRDYDTGWAPGQGAEGALRCSTVCGRTIAIMRPGALSSGEHARLPAIPVSQPP